MGGKHVTAYAKGHGHVLLDLQILAPHQETSVLTQLSQLPDDSDIDGAVSEHTGTPIPCDRQPTELAGRALSMAHTMICCVHDTQQR